MSYTLCKNDIPIEKDFVTFQEVFGDTLENLLQGGTLWTWGYNNLGRLGLGDTVHRSSPTQVGTLTDWKTLSVGTQNTRQIIKVDGSLWAFGISGYFAIGDGQIVNRSIPIRIGSANNWRSSYIGLSHHGLITSSGQLWTWGRNKDYITNANTITGQLGTNTSIAFLSVPTQVGTDTNWGKFSPGKHHSLSIKTDGTLWVWGSNNYYTYNSDNGQTYSFFGGQLGIPGVKFSSPTQVGALNNWKSVVASSYSSLSVKTDGTLWVWGKNYSGLLGLGDIVNRSSPTQVGALNNWKTVDSSLYSSLAVKTDGTLWVWGSNNNGVLGLGDRVHRSSPTQVGALNNWKEVSVDGNVSTAIKTDGTLWTWGFNGAGRLGLGDIVHRSSPTQVGALNNWKSIDSSGIATKFIF